MIMSIVRQILNKLICPDDCSLVEDLDDNHKVKQYAIERGLLGKFLDAFWRQHV